MNIDNIDESNYNRELFLIPKKDRKTQIENKNKNNGIIQNNNINQETIQEGNNNMNQIKYIKKNIKLKKNVLIKEII